MKTSGATPLQVLLSIVGLPKGSKNFWNAWLAILSFFVCVSTPITWSSTNPGSQTIVLPNDYQTERRPLIHMIKQLLNCVNKPLCVYVSFVVEKKAFLRSERFACTLG
mmetsp:Transcript_18703/g.31267  ORF Transcript_18703/g.31267 Transcript_18703/m.31267 type:complete len:108 (+) Transcript_18703:230-553(+)